MDLKLINIVDNCQTSAANHLKSVKLMEREYNKMAFTGFSRVYLNILQAVMEQNFHNPNVQNTIEFMGYFVGYITTVQHEAHSDGFEPDLLKFLITEITKMQEVYIPAEVKQSICLFWSSTLRNIGDDVSLENSLGQSIQNHLLEAIQDINRVVRYQAVLALARLQNPTNRECPVIKAFITCLNDSNYMVRREAVRWIAPNKDTISKLSEKVRDNNYKVQMTAFIRVSDIGIKFFKIVQRQEILRSGFEATNSKVKMMFMERLLPSWLSNLERSYLGVLKAIKFDGDEDDIAETEELSTKIMEVFFKTEPINNLIDALPLDDSKIIPEHLVNTELILYWNIVVTYLRQSEDLEEYLDKVIPDLTLFCNYISRIVQKGLFNNLEEWEYVNNQFILYHLFDMADKYDLSEEMGRKTLRELIKELLSKHRLQSRLLNKLVQIGVKLEHNVESFAFEANVIISNVWQPMVDMPLDKDAQRENAYKVSELKVKQVMLDCELESAIAAGEFVKAEDLTQRIREVKTDLAKLVSENVEVEKARVPADDPDTLCWCLDILAAVLGYSNMQELPSCLLTTRQNFLMPLIEHNNPEVYRRAFKCLAIYCIFDRQLAKESWKTFCNLLCVYRYKQDLNKNLLIDTISIVTDLVRDSETNLFSTESDCPSVHQNTKIRLYNEDADELDSLTNTNLTIDSIFHLFLDMLDDDNDDIRHAAVTALFKLILSGFPIDFMGIARLILKWCHPVTRLPLQQMIGVIVNSFVAQIENAREVVVKAIVPVINKLCETPRSSSLADIDIISAIKLLTAITDGPSKDPALHVHIQVAAILVHEISSRPSELSTIYFAKMLKYLQINPDNNSAIPELTKKCDLLLEKTTLEKGTRKEVTKFVAKLGADVSMCTTTTEALQLDENATIRTSVSGDSNRIEVTQNKLLPQKSSLSPVIEESSSVNSTDQSTCTEARKCPPKKRKKLKYTTVQRRSTRNSKENQQPDPILGKTCQTMTSTVQYSSSESSPDVIPSSQPSLQRGSNICQASNNKFKDQIQRNNKPKELVVRLHKQKPRTVNGGKKTSLEVNSSDSSVSQSESFSSNSTKNLRRSQRNIARCSVLTQANGTKNIAATVSVQINREEKNRKSLPSCNSTNNLVVNGFDTSDQTLHTIIEAPEDRISILADDSPVPQRSSRRKRAARSPSASDESQEPVLKKKAT